MTTIETRRLSIRVLLLAAPVIFIAHWLEEAPGFVAWFNAHVDRGIDQSLFQTVNSTGLVITVAVVALEWFTRSQASALAAAAWLGFLMAANGLFHIVASVVDSTYVPGVYSAAVLYLPFFALFIALLLRERRVAPGIVVAAVVVGSIPMLVHCYLILFERSRLF